MIICWVIPENCAFSLGSSLGDKCEMWAAESPAALLLQDNLKEIPDLGFSGLLRIYVVNFKLQLQIHKSICFQNCLSGSGG